MGTVVWFLRRKGRKFPYNLRFMRRVLAIVAGVMLLAGVSLGQMDLPLQAANPVTAESARAVAAVAESSGAGAASVPQTVELARAQEGGQQPSATRPAIPPRPSQGGPESGNSTLKDKLQEFQAQYGGGIDSMGGAGAEIVLQPKKVRSTFNLSGDTRSIYTQLATFFGLRVTFDESTPSRSVRFQLQDADFNTAMLVAGLMTHTFWVPVAKDEMLVAADNQQKRRELERMVEETFYLSDATTPQEINDVVNMLRTLLEVRFVTQQPGTSSITVRAPQQTMRAAEVLLSSLALNRPQVMLQVQVFEVNQSMLRTVGVQLPLQFQMFNIPSNILDLLNSPALQSQIAQLLAQGNLNTADLSALAPLLGQFQNQLSSLLANPIATFGGGLTLFGVGIPPATANFSLNESRVRSLEDTTLRAAQGNAASLHIGTRYPVLTQSFTPGVGIPGFGSSNLGIVGAVPGFNYEDLGVSVKAKPQIHGTDAVTLDMELDIRTLGAQTFNSIPVIQNRTYKGMIRVNNGETAVMAGMLSKTEQKTLAGVPAIGRLPLFDRLLSNENKNELETELVVVITPRIVSSTPQATPIVAVGQ